MYWVASITNWSPSKELEKIFKHKISEADMTINDADQSNRVMTYIEELI